MAKKQVIKLTENDLHRIIKESVNNVLTELDWRTYANAAKKAESNGDSDRARKFRQAASKSSNKRGYNDKYMQTYSNANIDFNDGKAVPYGSNLDDWDEYDSISGFKEDGYDYETTKYPGQRFYADPSYINNKDVARHYVDLENQARDYNNGKSEYIKGKGWK